jgi:hypothetical protein
VPGRVKQEDGQEVDNMVKQVLMVLVLLLGWFATAGQADDVSREQVKGLDEQVQEIKQDVLGISADLNRLEEKLLYPSNTEVSVFIGIARGDKFRLDAVEIQIDGKVVANHLYTFKELEALQEGGIQRIYTGNITKGDHDLRINFVGKSGGSQQHGTANYKVTKDIGPKLVGITLATPGLVNSGISFKDW